MTTTSRYWDHQRCCWVAYEAPAPATAAVPELPADALPEQRTDETVVVPAT
jgi:hypothetical protein